MDLFDLARYGVLPKNKKILLFEAFSGIGTQAMAFERLKELIGIDYEVVGFSEIDKYAIMSYHAIHGEHLKNYGDIAKIEQLPKCDVCTWSFPCQDISLAGHQKGMVEGTRSNYGFDFIETVRRSEHKPKILIMENVKALVSERFQDDFNEIQERLKSMGYENHWKVLNAKHYGVAQNRERVFMISILGGGWFQFPPKIKLTKRLKDYLEDEVDEKYYLSDETIKRISRWKAQQNPLENMERIHKIGISSTITARGAGEEHSGMILMKEATKQGYAIAEDGEGVYINRPHQKRGVVQKGMIQTIKTGQDVGVVVEHKNVVEAYNNFIDKNGYIPEFFNPYNNSEIKDISPTITTMCDRWQSSSTISITNNLRIRKLTPRECWRLMDISDDDYDKASKVCSNSQLYKQAGNAIVVNVLVQIFKNLIE